MTEQIKSIEFDGNHNVVIQSVQNSTVKVETIDWDSFVQKYTIEQRERIQELQKLLSRSEELFGLKEQKYAQQISELQQDIQQKETQLKNIIQQYKDKDLQATTSLYQRAFAHFVAGELDKALEVLDDAQLDEAEQQQAEARILKANILHLENRFEEAEKQFKRAVDIYPSWDNMFTIATFYQFLNKFSKAEYYYYECLKEDINDTERVATLNNLGMIYFSKNEFDKAEDIYQKALEIGKNSKLVIEQANWVIGLALNNLANLYKMKNEFGRAEVIYNETLAMHRYLVQIDFEKYLPNLLGTLNNLGSFYKDRNEFYKAEQIYAEALPIVKEFVQAEPKLHLPHLASTLVNIGNFYLEQEKYDKAEPMFEEGLEKHRKLVEINRQRNLPNLALNLNSLMILYRRKGELHKAEQIGEEALTIFQYLSKLDPQSYLPDVGIILHNLVNMCMNKGDINRADEMCEEAILIYRPLAKIYPEVYLPKLALMLNSLAGIHLHRLEFGKLELIMEEAIEIYRKFTKTEPQKYFPELARALGNMSRFYCLNRPKKEKSISMATEVIKIAIQFQHIPAVGQYADVGHKVLERWGVNVDSLIKKIIEDLPKPT